MERVQTSALQDEIIKVIRANTLPNDFGTSNLNDSDILVISKEIEELFLKKYIRKGVKKYLPICRVHHILWSYGYVIVPLFSKTLGWFGKDGVKLVNRTEFHNCTWTGVY